MEDSSQKSIYTSQYSETPGAPDKHIQGQVKMKVGTQKMNNTTSFDGVIISLPNTGKWKKYLHQRKAAGVAEAMKLSIHLFGDIGYSLFFDVLLVQTSPIGFSQGSTALSSFLSAPNVCNKDSKPIECTAIAMNSTNNDPRLTKTFFTLLIDNTWWIQYQIICASARAPFNTYSF